MHSHICPSISDLYYLQDYTIAFSYSINDLFLSEAWSDFQLYGKIQAKDYVQMWTVNYEADEAESDTQTR